MANNVLIASDGGPWTTVGANWTAITGLLKCTVASGATRPNTLSVEAGQIYTGTAFPNDHISAATINLNSNPTTNFQLCVRMQSGAYSGYKLAAGSATATIYRVDAGVATQLATIGSLGAFANGDIWEFSAAGSVLSGYFNGKRVVYAADDTYTGGSPGFIQFSSTDLTQTNGSSWRGYNVIQQDGIWSKKGVIIPLAAADIASSGFGRWNVSNILYEGNAQLLSGTVYKMWFMSGGNSAGNQGQSRYAESSDGLAWTIRSSPVIANFGIQALVKVAGTYYAWGQGGTAQGTGNVSAYTSSDGITWNLQNSNFLSLGTAGQWDAGNLYIQCNPQIILGVWNFLYGGAPSPNSPVSFNSGIATSPDGLTTATKFGSNPVLTPGVSGPLIAIGNTYYTYTAAGPGPNNTRFAGNAFNPAETIRYQSSDLRTWTPTGGVGSLHASQLHEAVNDPHGNATSCIIIDIGGIAYNYYIGGPSDSVAPQYYQINLATGPAPIAQIVAKPEDGTLQTSTDSFTSGLGDLSANWATPVGGTKLAIVAGNKVEATTTGAYNVMRYVGANAPTSANHYSEITCVTLNASTSFVLPAVRVQSGANSGYIAQVQGAFGTLQTGGSGILKLTAGATALLQGSSLIPLRAATGDVYRLAVTTVNNLPVLSFYQNGRLVQQAVDYSNAYTTGSPGMGINTATLAGSEISLFGGGTAGVVPLYPTGPASNISVTMRDGTVVTATIPPMMTATAYITLLHESGGIWDIPPDPATPANWWPYRYWQKVFTS